MMSAVNWKLCGMAAGMVFLIVLPFTGPSIAAILGLAGGVFAWLSEGDAFHRRTVKPSVESSVETASSIPKRASIGQVSEIFSRYATPVKTLGIAVALILPWTLNRYHVEILTLGLIYVTLAVGLNYIVGLCGLLALGYIAFYAVGAYTYALLNTHFGVNFFLALPLGFITGAAAGALVGLPVLRLRGDYLAIVTLGFGEIVRIILNNWDQVTAGPNGIMGIARPTLFGFKLGTSQGYYYLAALLAAIVIFTQRRLIGSKIGRAWEAIREDELAAAHSGIPVVHTKLAAMILGGAWAGAAGALFAARMTHVSPESFTFLESVLVLCMVVLGGMGSVTGVAVGAMALIAAPELLRGIASYRMLAFGLLMVLMMRYRRTGLIPGKRLKVEPGRV